MLANLNSPQQEAVTTTEGPLLLLAGAGSGKTRVITHRIAYLIVEKSIFPYRICALTFTNKAAAEMKSRVIDLLPNSGHLVMIKTFHSLCLYILRRHTDKLGFDSAFTVYDSSLSESLLKEIIKDLTLDTKAFKPSKINAIIQGAKDRMVGPKEFSEENNQDPFYKSISKIYEIYENRKRSRNALDFGDLILKTVKLFEDFPEVRDGYNQLWTYVMIDEYQDTNRSQYLLTLLLSGKSKNICVVGDDDQSIYSWRGADIRNILDFEKDFPGTKIIKLEENYRSTGSIIRAAGDLILNNLERKNKKIFTNNPIGEPITLREYPSESDEAFSIRTQIEEFYKSQKSYNGIAVFYRTNAQSRFFEEELRKKNIPYKIYGGFRFFDRLEIKDMIAYLTLLINPNDSGSLSRIINFPARGIGETTIEKIRSFSLSKNISMYDALSTRDLELRKSVRSALDSFLESMQYLKSRLLNGDRPSLVAREMLETMGIEAHYKNENDLESIDRLENIQQLIESIQEYEEQTESPTLDDYLNNVCLLTSEENSADLTDFVTLMTVHNSKGLEFPIVFLSGMEDGTFPHFMSIEEPGGIEEERRLCYVAITRAKQKLFISYCKYTRKYGEIQSREPSRFLSELPEQVLEWKRTGENFRSPAVSPRADRSFPQLSKEKSSASKEINTKGEFQKGKKVRHKEYGIGTILDISGSGDNRKAKIQFGFTHKNFLLAYTPLEIIN
ncbi:MAG: UvrD-helicase domain-containing protein [Leptospiraceae bacterium]|nr:UvrD-helicase domain-containing protein [Leptospiraceae bacterium]MCP5511963.1 UvrD-helicase domain-containing protein [Leptospiraceae bacterium]